MKQNIKFKILNSAFLFGLLVSQLFNFFSEDYQNSNFIENSFYHTYFCKSSKTHQSFNQFYQVKEFEKLINMWIKITLFVVLDFNPK